MNKCIKRCFWQALLAQMKHACATDKESAIKIGLAI